MKKIILILSIIALLISSYWTYKTNFDSEPILVLIASIIGILTSFINTNKKNDRNFSFANNQKSHSEISITNQINIDDVNESIEKKESKDISKSQKNEAIIDSMKTKLKILFIDDDKNFNVVTILKDSGWKNTKAVIDIKSIDIPIVKDSHILFVDINGIGKLLNCPDEGLDIALMLKQKYPEKKVIIYSANPKNNIFHKAWDECDGRLEKNALPYQFQVLVEEHSLKIA